MAETLGHKRRSLSVRAYLLVMVLAILLPVGAFAGVLFWRYADSEIARIDQQLENDAHGLALDVDRDLQGKIITLETLATANSMESHDYARFYDRAMRVKDLAGVDISLRGRDGQQLANTRVPWERRCRAIFIRTTKKRPRLGNRMSATSSRGQSPAIPFISSAFRSARTVRSLTFFI
ncbi:MAG: hypothetical protein WBC94_20765 [Xanthobacteraceae bacterium]